MCSAVMHFSVENKHGDVLEKIDMIRRSFRRVITLFPVVICTWFVLSVDGDHIKCENLLMGQYRCEEPKIDPNTQSEEGCQENHTTKVDCRLAPGLTCGAQNTTSFQRDVPCHYTNGHSYETALLLSVFLGMFGIDRFYLGYPAIGLLKFSTLGFFFIFHLVDIILIATQVVGPANGTSYVIDYYGPRLIHISTSNETFYKPQDFR